MMHLEQQGRDSVENSVDTKNMWEFRTQEIQLGRWIQSGGQGSVYRGTFKRKTVAVNVVKTLDQTEITHLRYLKHRNIVHIFGVCTQAPRFCIIMEYCPQGSLFDVIHTKERKLCPKMFILWLKQIAIGMKYLHKNYILHCDLKSVNIFLSCHGDNAKIGQLCSSQNLRELRPQRKLIFSPGWAAPELARDKTPTFQTDIWAYGVIVWELTTRLLPHGLLGRDVILRGLSNNQLELQVPESTPVGLKMLLSKCHATEPQRRPSFDEIVHLLETAAEDVKGFTRDSFYIAQLHWQQVAQWRSQEDKQAKKLQLLKSSGCITFDYIDIEKESPQTRQFALIISIFIPIIVILLSTHICL